MALVEHLGHLVRNAGDRRRRPCSRQGRSDRGRTHHLTYRNRATGNVGLSEVRLWHLAIAGRENILIASISDSSRSIGTFITSANYSRG